MSRAQLRPLILLALVSGGAPAAVGQTSTVVDVLEGNAALFSNRLVIAQGVATGVFSFAHGTNTVAGAPYSIALGAGARAMHANSFVWSDGMSLQTATSRQFIVHATNGIFLLGGPIVGNAIGLTNVAASGIVGLGSAAWSAAGDFASAAQGDLADTSLQSSGGVSWAAAQNAGGQQLTNLAAAFSTTIGSVTSVVTNAVFRGLYVSTNSNDYGVRTPPIGVYYGNSTTGYVGPGSFLPHSAFSNAWAFSWYWEDADSMWWSPTNIFGCAEYLVWIYPEGITNESGDLVAIQINSGYGSIDGTYSGNTNSGFYGGPRGASITHDTNGFWHLSHFMGETNLLTAPYDGISTGTVEVTGNFYYNMDLAAHIEDVMTQTVAAVTNAMPLAIADGRYTWLGTHNAGNYGLTNLSLLGASSFAGDGSTLFNIGSAAILDGSVTLADLDISALDGRYVVKVGNSTVVGDIEVTGTLTRNGWPIESLDQISPQGDVRMGHFTMTNAPPAP